MDKEYLPQTYHEAVSFYQLLSELDTLVSNENSHILGILPVTTDIPKQRIREWIKNWHEVLRELELHH